jgi:hypothetical protein
MPPGWHPDETEGQEIGKGRDRTGLTSNKREEREADLGQEEHREREDSHFLAMS